MKPFEFKQFTILQDRSAMKIGTDGVLLGAWTPLGSSINAILDIGTGTGVIALMLAQRCDSQIIDGLEIDSEAYEQAVENFEASPWGDRLFCYHASFQEFFEEIEDEYDLIISNPPFYAEDVKTASKQRNMARFQDALPFEHLFYGASKLLSKQGKLSIVIPYSEEERVIEIAQLVKLYPEKITRVRGNNSSPIKRSLLFFSYQSKDPVIDELIIEKGRHEYTKAYVELTKDFYINM